ncbi:kinase-like domain-containing protein [Mycena maculata]|uniref:Kinase-like domain-containing protein n=1 Tax=Mycena maculata TaxID=230809 RepID=A0AAD7HNZ5_9AGAR|nr:kinase-like domain-containing protein [Mycena maculata]
MVSATDTFGFGDGEEDAYGPYGGADEYGAEEDEEEEEDEEGTLGPKARAALGLSEAPPPISTSTPPLTRPTVVTTHGGTGGLLSPGPLTALSLAGQTPTTPASRYAGWVAAAVAPLAAFLDEPVDPRDVYGDLTEIAEGESGSVFAAAVVAAEREVGRLRLPPAVKARDLAAMKEGGGRVLVAIKQVPLVPPPRSPFSPASPGSAPGGATGKIAEVRRECTVLAGLWHEHILGLDALYVDLVEDALWIRMELMERSLADVVGLVEEGLRLQEARVLGRFASDMLHALDYLQTHGIAHRDLRSDNLLLNAEGVLKLTDFSNAVRVADDDPLCTDPAGVLYWQAPEVRAGAYDPLKIDVWSVGATVWELAEAAPPFAAEPDPVAAAADTARWPPVSNPALYPPAFHDFLRMCSEPAASRPSPAALLETPFVQKACGRPVIVQLLSRCMAIEQAQSGDAPGSASVPPSPP